MKCRNEGADSDESQHPVTPGRLPDGRNDHDDHRQCVGQQRNPKERRLVNKIHGGEPRQLEAYPYLLLLKVKLASIIVVSEQLRMTRPTDGDIQLFFGSITEFALKLVKKVASRRAVGIVALQGVIDPIDQWQAQNPSG